MSPDPLYLADSERPIRPLEMQDRYRFFLTFRLRNVQYTRWFTDPTTRAAYFQNLPGAQLMNAGEDKRESREADYRVLDALNLKPLKTRIPRR